MTSLCFNVNVTCIVLHRTCIFRKTHRYKLRIVYCIWNNLYVTNYCCMLFSACTNGTYGEKCKLTCGHCYGNSACNHVNGSCPNGCASGWTRAVCNESERIMFFFFKTVFTMSSCIHWKYIDFDMHNYAIYEYTHISQDIFRRFYFNQKQFWLLKIKLFSPDRLSSRVLWNHV